MPDAVNAPLQHPASADVPARQATDSARAHPLVAVLVLVAAVIVASLAWVVASPVGASPDEDFHVGAMWCPPPIEDSGCQIGTKDGRKAVIVPQTLAKENVTCYAYDHDNSARCTFAASDDLTAPTLRWDDGNYPWGYYQFAHLFVQHSTNRRRPAAWALGASASLPARSRVPSWPAHRAGTAHFSFLSSPSRSRVRYDRAHASFRKLSSRARPRSWASGLCRGRTHRQTWRRPRPVPHLPGAARFSCRTWRRSPPTWPVSSAIASGLGGTMYPTRARCPTGLS